MTTRELSLKKCCNLEIKTKIPTIFMGLHCCDDAMTFVITCFLSFFIIGKKNHTIYKKEVIVISLIFSVIFFPSKLFVCCALVIAFYFIFPGHIINIFVKPLLIFYLFYWL